DEVEGLIRQRHLDEHVTGKELTLGWNLARAPHLDHFLGGHDDVLEQVLEPSLSRALADGVGYLALEISISVHDVPTLRHSTWILRFLEPLLRNSHSASADASEAEDEADEPAQNLVGDQEEDGRQRHHDHNRHVGDPHLLASRPRDLCGLLANFLNELERIVLCHYR